jgi:hypothetical protein
VRRRLERIPLPDESGARERVRRVVRAAYAEREPLPVERRRAVPLAVAAAGLAVAATVFTGPGMAVLDSVRRAVGVQHAQPALFSLPTPGRLLVVERPLFTAGAVWVVQPDGSRRRLGEYRDASWSPFGRFVVVATVNELRTLEPNGKIHWTLARPRVRSPRWSGSRTDTRIAYLSGDELRIVAGDGTGDRLLARHVRGQLAWRPGPRHQLAYNSAGWLYLRDADSRRLVWSRRIRGIALDGLEWSGDGERLVGLSPSDLLVFDALGHERRRIHSATPEFLAGALSPQGRLAYVRRSPDREDGASEVILESGKRVFAGTGDFTDLEWSPDGHWLLVGWSAADQWVFVRVDPPTRIVADGGIARQFEGRFPDVAGWCCG